MANAAALITREGGARTRLARNASLQPRPGWVLELVVAVLTSSNQPLRPQDILRRAEQLDGRSLALAPSSLRNALRLASQDRDGPVERLGYGLYGLRREHRR